MQRTYAKDVSSKIGESIKLQGWVHTIRDQGGIKFLLLRDITGVVQTVVKKANTAIFESLVDLTLESVVEIVGVVKAESQAPDGVEVVLEVLTVLAPAAPELPIPVIVEKGGNETEAPKRFDWRWLDLRKPDKFQIFRVWTALEQGFRDHLVKAGYVQVYPPAFMTAPSESGADVFEVSYFDRKAYLAQSPQFYKQMAMASGFEKVFMTSPVFRAEPSFTTRHTTEFTGWDFEISFIESHYDAMDELEAFVVSGFTKVKELLLPDLVIPERPFPRITMKAAKQRLGEKGIPSAKDSDVSPEEERELCKLIQQEAGHDFVFLIDYPIDARPFYHMRHANAPELTKSFDLLYKGLEITTGAQREHRIDILEKQALEKDVSLESIKDYLNFFRYGCPPHGGGGIGPGRIVMGLLELASVKEATFLPRDVKRLTP